MDRKKVLFYSTNSLGILHLGEELELLNKYTNDGADIHILKCSGGLGSCYLNATHNLFGCAMCIASRDSSHAQFNFDKAKIHLVKDFNLDIDFPQFENLDQILGYYYKDISIGRGVASSCISLLREYEINGSDTRQQELIKELLKTAVNVSENLLELLEQEEFDEILFFNGRFTELYPAMEIAKLRGITFYTFERGATEAQYQFFKNALPHSISKRTEYMNQLWEEAGDGKYQLATDWFESQVNSADGVSKRFTAHQSEGKLPTQFEKDKMNVVIFNSSEDETKVIEEWQFGAYKHQNEAIKKIVENFKGNDSIQFYLRVHPNLRGVDSIQIREIDAFEFDNLKVIDGYSDISTYALIKNADKIICFGSTVGIEATYLGKVSLMFGRSLYENIDASYCPKTYDELFELITDENLVPKEKENTLRYAYYRANYGLFHEHFKFENKRLGYFKGKKLKQVSFRSFITLLKLLKYFKHWNKMNKILVNQRVTFGNMLKLKTHFKKS